MPAAGAPDARGATPASSPLLRPLRLGVHSARNRIFFGPHETNLARGRAISDRHVAYYRRRAAGGCGVVVTEEASVHPSDWPTERSPLASSCGPGWAALAQAVHAEGALAVASLGHAGGQGSSAYSQLAMWAPSRVPEVATREVPKSMEAEDIAAVIAGFAAATRLALGSGLDGIEINGGQHSLLRQFCSALTNQRQDRWGSDRLAFAREVLGAVRSAAGDAVVGLRLCADELAPWAGITPDDAPAIATALAAPLDYVVVVRGSIFSAGATRPDGHTAGGFNLDVTHRVRAALRAAGHEVAVVAQGSLVDTAVAEAAVAAGSADAVEMTRAQIADADLPRLLASGERGRIRPCILCNQSCAVRDPRNPIVSCVGDPDSGREWERPSGRRGTVALPRLRTTAAPAGPAGADRGHDGTRADTEVLVVGGGPAGMECARVAAEGGARVRLVERRLWLGGALRVAAQASGRRRLAMLADWLEAELRRLGVEVELGRRLGMKDLAPAGGPFGGAAAEPWDAAVAVVLATGSRPGRPTWSAAGRAVVRSALDVLEPTVDLGRVDVPQGPVLVWDPIGGPIGVSVAETLAEAGHPVRLATPDFVVGTQLARSGDLSPANARLHALGVVLERSSILREVGPGSATLEDRWSGEARRVEAGSVVDAGHRLPDDELWLSVTAPWRVTATATGQPGPANHRGPGPRLRATPTWRAGDAVAPRGVHEAVLEGRRCAEAVLEGRWCTDALPGAP